MVRLVAAGVLVAAATFIAAAAREHASAGPVVAGAPRVVDSTFLCSVGRSPGGYPDPVVQRRTLIFAAGSTTEGKQRSSSASVGDKYAALTVLHLFVGPFRDRYGTVLAGVHVNAKPCRLVRSPPFPLSSAKLRRVKSQSWERHACDVPGSVLIRMRAVLGRFALWFKSGANDWRTPMLTLRSNVVDASFAIRTVSSHKPIAFVRLTRTGPPKLSLSAHCTEVT